MLQTRPEIHRHCSYLHLNRHSDSVVEEVNGYIYYKVQTTIAVCLRLFYVVLHAHDFKVGVLSDVFLNGVHIADIAAHNPHTRKVEYVFPYAFGSDRQVAAFELLIYTVGTFDSRTDTLYVVSVVCKFQLGFQRGKA